MTAEPLTTYERAMVEQELVDLETQLVAVIAKPPLDNDYAKAKRILWVVRTMGEIERLESLLGTRHLRVVA